MKKVICFILGVALGVGAAFGARFVLSLYNYKMYHTTEASSVQSSQYDSNSIYTTYYNDNRKQYADEVNFPLPDEELLVFEDAELDKCIHDFQGDGKGVLVCTYPVGMQDVYAKIFTTDDNGENWELLHNNYHFLSGRIDVFYFGDSITLINVLSANGETIVHKSADNGKTFTNTPLEINPDSTDYAAPSVISTDRENNTVIIAWHLPSTDELIAVCEHDGITFEITKEFYLD